MCLLSLLLNLNVFAAKIVYRFRRYSSYILSLIFVLKLNLTHSPLFVYKFAAKVPNMSSYQYLNNRNEWMAAFIVAESYENIKLQQEEEEEAPFKSHWRVSAALPPGHKVTVVSRRQSEEIQSQQDCLKIERSEEELVSSFYLKFAANLR